MTSKRQDPEGVDTRGKTVPPYKGRKEGGRVRGHSESTENGPRTGGATGPVEDDAMKAPDPERTPGGATTSPAREKPAGGSHRSRRDPEKGTGPAHQQGVRRAEDQG
ncbi:hypothetical protein [Streptomyces sp. NBC_01497]|uniref:hypothetical protein n=1 Tax=Streptomyces sp. NBC_01497 TaxID=2903885 RepID=UPI002E34AEE2|nr:hypothetical protein [Streptomyces sp. NBC_01497]